MLTPGHFPRFILRILASTACFTVFSLLGCSDGGDSNAGNAESLLPFQTYVLATQPRGGQCDDTIDVAAPLISSSHGFDLRNTRNASSIIRADNVDQLDLNFTYAKPDAGEIRGAAAVSAQAIFFTAGNAVIAINRVSGCRYWQYDEPEAGVVFRSAAVLLSLDDPDAPMVFVGDSSGFVHALDATDGSMLWKTFVGTDSDAHFVTGGMVYHDGKVIVPVSSKEVAIGAFRPGGCCTTHGMLGALRGATGEQLWAYHTTPEATTILQPGERLGPNGAPVWSTPTIDVQRNAVYFGTGQNYTEPTTQTSDAIIALDLDSGQEKWVFQATAGDAWNYACNFNLPLRCPSPEGHDFDFGAAPILAEDATLIAGDKGGMVYSIDAQTGALNWSKKISIGSKLGGIHWGMAADDANVYLAATDFEVDPASGGLQDLVPGANPGVYALDQATGDTVWEIHPTRQFEGRETPSLYSASLAITNDVLFAGSLDGVLNAFSVTDGRQLWAYDVNRPLTDINGIEGDGGTIDGAGFIISGDGLVVNSGYSEIFGGVGRYQAGAGNTLFVLSLPAQ